MALPFPVSTGSASAVLLQSQDLAVPGIIVSFGLGPGFVGEAPAPRIFLFPEEDRALVFFGDSRVCEFGPCPRTFSFPALDSGGCTVADQIHEFPSKDPGDVLDYTYDFTNLLESGEQITAINSVIVSPTSATTPLTVDSSGIVTGGKKVTVVLSGGEACVEYTVTVSVTTNSSPARTYERSCIVPVEDL